MELIGQADDEEGLRHLYLECLPTFSAWQTLAQDDLWASLVESENGFALFVAMDASSLSVDEIVAFADYLIEQGVFWVSTWGPDCERVHDIFDEVDVGDGAEERKPVVMTQWHAEEPLDEATLLFWTAFADEGKPSGPARIALSIGSAEWCEALRRLSERHLNIWS